MSVILMQARHAGEILHAHQQLDKAVLLLLVEEERPMRNATPLMIAPPRLELPLLSHLARSVSHNDLTRNDIFTPTYSPGSDPRIRNQAHFSKPISYPTIRNKIPHMPTQGSKFTCFRMHSCIIHVSLSDWAYDADTFQSLKILQYGHMCSIRNR